LTYNATQGAFPKTAATSNPTVQINPLKRFQERSGKAAKEQAGSREQTGVREQGVVKEQTVIREKPVEQARAEDQDNSGNVVYADRPRGIPIRQEIPTDQEM
jgi:hypothetical protein